MKKLIVFALILLMFTALSVNVYAEVPAYEAPVEEETDNTSEWLKGLSSTTSIITIAVSTLGFGGTAALLTSGLKNILKLVSDKADKKTIVSAIDNEVVNIKKVFFEELEKAKAELSDSTKRTEKLTAVIGIMAQYSKMPDSAKLQITEILNKTADKCEEASEVIKDAVKVIEEAEATVEKVETPALDELVNSINMG